MGSGGKGRLCWHRGRWHVEFYEDGKRRRTSLGTDDRGIAEAHLAEWRRSYAVASAGGPLTVGDIYEAYALDRERAGKAAAPRIRDAWRRLAPTFSSLLPHHVSKSICHVYTDQRRRHASAGTVHVELGYLRASLKFAEAEKWLQSAPFIPLPRKPAPRDHRLTRDEIHRLRAAATMPHVKLFITLAITTAARAGAILDLTWDRVDLDRRRIKLANPLRGETNKGRATVPINDTALEALSEARQRATCEHVIEWGRQAGDKRQEGSGGSIGAVV